MTTFDLQSILRSKAALRQHLAAQPIGEKLRLLDELRDRALTLAASRRTAKTLDELEKEIQQGRKKLEGMLR